MLAVVAAACTMIVLAAVVTNPTNAKEVGWPNPPCPPPPVRQPMCEEYTPENIHNIRKRLPEKEWIEVLVVDENGRPLKDATVRFYEWTCHTYENGKTELTYIPGWRCVSVAKDEYVTEDDIPIKLTPPVTKATIKLHKSKVTPEQDKSKAGDLPRKRFPY